MARRKKKRGLAYYITMLLMVSAIVFCAVNYGPIIYTEINRLNADNILEQSILKDKKFTARVHEIKINDISAYFMEEHSNPIVSVNFSFRKAGSAYEDIRKLGIGEILAEMLLAGSGSYDEFGFKEICAEYGIKIGFDTSKDNFEGEIVFPKQYENEAVKLLHDVLNRPHLPEDYLDLVKQQVYLAQKVQEENIERLLGLKFNEFIFAGHPYERNALGTRLSVQNITTDDLRDFMQSHLTRDSLIVGIVGDLTIDAAQNFLQKVFADLPHKSETERLSHLNLSFSGEEYNIDRQSAQAISLFVTEGSYRDSIDFYPLFIANYILGESGLDSRLSKEIREKKGLTYGIYTYLSIDDASALIVGKYSSTRDNFTEAKNILLKEWKKFARDGASEDELNKAKQSLISSYNLRFANIDDISKMLMLMQLYNLGRDFLDKRNDYINNVNLQEVNAAAKKYFSGTPDFVNIGMKGTEDK